MTDTLSSKPAPELSLCAPGLMYENPAYLYLARLGVEARSTTRSALRTIARFFLPGADLETFPWAHLRYPHAVALRAHLARRYSSNTANRMMCAFRRVLREAWRLQLISLDELERAVDVEKLPCHRLMRGRAPTLSEVAAMLLCASTDKKRRRGVQDAALVWLLFGAGLRRSEVAGLDLDNIEEEGCELFVRVIGKGNRERRVPLPPQAHRPLLAYIEQREREPGPLFFTQRRCRPHGVTIFTWMLKLALRAGVARTTPHDCRRAFISEVLDNGSDLAVAQALAGHVSPSTTARYDRRPERARVEAVARLRVPGAP